VLERRFDALSVERVEIPSVSLMAYEAVLSHGPTRDASLEVEMTEQARRRDQAHYEVQIERHGERIRLYDEVLQGPLGDPSRTSLSDRRTADLAALEGLRKAAAARAWRVGALADPATRLGDLPLVRKAIAARLAHLQEEAKMPGRSGRPPDLVRPIRELADAVHVLTGDRREATSIHLLADRLERDGASPEERPRVEAQQAGWGPPWLLSDTSGIAPASLEALSAPN
jgi:hypothetical protein